MLFRQGWRLPCGLGAEYAFTDNLIGRLEARYTDFGDSDFALGDLDFAGVEGGDVNVDWT